MQLLKTEEELERLRSEKQWTSSVSDDKLNELQQHNSSLMSRAYVARFVWHFVSELYHRVTTVIITLTPLANDQLPIVSLLILFQNRVGAVRGIFWDQSEQIAHSRSVHVIGQFVNADCWHEVRHSVFRMTVYLENRENSGNSKRVWEISGNDDKSGKGESWEN